MDYWVNRIAHEYPISGILFRYGYLPVGWSNSAVELLEASNHGRKLFKDLFYKTFTDITNEDSL